MKIYRKNRTQMARLFSIGTVYMFGFLVGDSCGKKRIELLNGEVKAVSHNPSTKDNEEPVSEEFEEEIVPHSTMCNRRTRIFKDGRTEIDFLGNGKSSKLQS